MSYPDPARIVVLSSLLLSVEYASDASLELAFRSGARYRYLAVPPSVVQGLLTAPSKGAYFNRHIRNRFSYQRLA